MKISGVYAFTSPSGGRYVGSAVDIVRRRNQHLVALRRGTHCNPVLQKAFNKYGESNIKFEILMRCAREEVVATEQQFIDSLKPRYNIAKVAGSTLGTKRTAEQRARRSRISKALLNDPVYRANCAAARNAYWSDPEKKARHLANFLSPENRQRAKASLNKPETKARLRAAMAERRADPAFLAARIAGMQTPKAKALLRANVAAQFADPEKRARHRAATIAAVSTPDARAKNSAALKAKWGDPSYRQNVLAAREGTTRGERNGLSKLTDEAVLEIRAMRGRVAQPVLAKRFGVSQSLISLVQLGKVWAHITPKARAA